MPNTALSTPLCRHSFYPRLSDPRTYRMARIGLTTNQAGNMMDQSEGVMSKAPTERAIFAPSLRYLLALPYQILLTISDFLDLSTSSRQIIRITPRSPGQLKDGRTIAEWADKYVPSLRGSCDLTRWLPKWVCCSVRATNTADEGVVDICRPCIR